MNKTDRIERIRRDIDQQISYCHNRIDILNKRRNKLIGISKNSFDPQGSPCGKGITVCRSKLKEVLL